MCGHSDSEHLVSTIAVDFSIYKMILFIFYTVRCFGRQYVGARSRLPSQPQSGREAGEETEHGGQVPSTRVHLPRYRGVGGGETTSTIEDSSSIRLAADVHTERK